MRDPGGGRWGSKRAGPDPAGGPCCWSSARFWVAAVGAVLRRRPPRRRWRAATRGGSPWRSRRTARPGRWRDPHLHRRARPAGRPGSRSGQRCPHRDTDRPPRGRLCDHGDRPRRIHPGPGPAHRGGCPSGHQLRQRQLHLHHGQVIATLLPTNSGGPAVSWSISPAAPAGLIFSAADGSLSGTPTVVSAATSYLITATNSGGSSSVIASSSP
ncbi:MAG: putative Ig domain-containing protein [Holophagaceae bacterium]|nr:putative Ig domain-containing protein [Holophagaceae bacterium]